MTPLECSYARRKTHSLCPTFLLPLPAFLLSVWENKVIAGSSCHQTAQSGFCSAWLPKTPPSAASEPSFAWGHRWGRAKGLVEERAWPFLFLTPRLPPELLSSCSCTQRPSPGSPCPPLGAPPPIQPPPPFACYQPAALVAFYPRTVGVGVGVGAGVDNQKPRTVGLLLWGQGQTKSNKMTCEAPSALRL